MAKEVGKCGGRCEGVEQPRGAGGSGQHPRKGGPARGRPVLSPHCSRSSRPLPRRAGCCENKSVETYRKAWGTDQRDTLTAAVFSPNITAGGRALVRPEPFYPQPHLGQQEPLRPGIVPLDPSFPVTTPHLGVWGSLNPNPIPTGCFLLPALARCARPAGQLCFCTLSSQKAGPPAPSSRASLVLPSPCFSLHPTRQGTPGGKI